MNIFDEYFTGDCSIALENVSYKKLDDLNEDVTLSVNDDLNIKENVNGYNFIEIIITRNLSFAPKSLVDITVTFSVYLELNEKYAKNNVIDYKALKNYLLFKENTLTSIVMSRISLLISQLTSSYGERPIITPPSFMTED